MWGWRGSAYAFHRRKSSDARLAAALAGLVLCASPASAADVFEFAFPEPVTAVIAAAQADYVTIGGETFRLTPCDRPEGICLSTAPVKGLPKDAPRGALPDGKIATAEDGDIRQAWYGRPTGSYDHGVLGDAIEGGSLVVRTDRGRKQEVVLPETHVFEDITPRIHDIDGDGTNEVITIRSSLTRGAAVAVYGLRDGELIELGAGKEIGRRHRWLNIAGIIDASDGTATVYGVRTPHIGGELFSIRLKDGKIVEKNDLAKDVSNHVIGSRELGMWAIMDADGDGKPDLVLPSQDRTRLRFPLSDLPDIKLPEAIDKAIVAVNGRLVTATESGKLLAVAP